MFFRKLRCSFCRRTDDQVAKLVAGARGYICDRCATEVMRIMNEAAPMPDPRSSKSQVPSLESTPDTRDLRLATCDF